jgi:hypothetical protein
MANYQLYRKPLYMTGKQWHQITDADAKPETLFTDREKALQMLKLHNDFSTHPPKPMQASPIHHFLLVDYVAREADVSYGLFVGHSYKAKIRMEDGIATLPTLAGEATLTDDHSAIAYVVE